MQMACMCRPYVSIFSLDVTTMMGHHSINELYCTVPLSKVDVSQNQDTGFTLLIGR